jgi:hypothetical protein
MRNLVDGRGNWLHDAVKTAAQIIRRVRALAESAPDNLYDGSGYCRYTEGTCTDRSIGCIIGQALGPMGFKRWLRKIDSTPGGVSIGRALGRMDVATTPDETIWLSVVQDAQDSGKPWGEAVSKADRTVELHIALSQ